MQQPQQFWPRGVKAGLLLALVLAIPLFVAIFADVHDSAVTAITEAELPVSSVAP